METVMNLKRAWRAVLSALLGVGLALGAAEGIAAVWVNYFLEASDPGAFRDLKIIDRNQDRWDQHHYLNHVPQLGFRLLDESGVEVSAHNSLGFRGKEFPFRKTPGIFRIAMIGGSAVYSSRVRSDIGTIPAQLESALKSLGHENVEVINAGVSGYSTAEMLIQLQFRVLELSPDLVIVYEAINDLHNRYVPPELHRGDNRGRLQRWSGETFPFWARSYLGRALGYRLGYLQKYLYMDYYVGAPTYLGHTAPASATKGIDFKDLLRKNGTGYFRENLLSIQAICQARGIPVVFSTYGYTRQRQDLGYLATKDYQSGLEEMNEAIRSLARERGVPLIEFQTQMPEDKTFWRDEFHVSSQGAHKAGRIIAKKLIQLSLVPK